MRELVALAVLFGPVGCGPASVLLEPLAQWLDARYEGFRAPSEGMLPTLLVDDHFYIDKLAYTERDPIRGEAVIFELVRDGSSVLPVDQQPDLPHERFVKRIVAIPGDVIEWRNSELYINGEPVLAQPTGETLVTLSGRRLAIYSQELDTGTFRIASDRGYSDATIPPIRVEADRYFLLGDNRSNSRDSRHWGTIHRRDLIGPITGVYLSGWIPTWRRINP